MDGSQAIGKWIGSGKDQIAQTKDKNSNVCSSISPTKSSDNAKKLTFAPLFFLSTVFAQKTEMDAILKQMQFAARELLIDKYYPRNIDSVYGGYLSSFSYDFKPVGDQDKMIVTQARNVWSTSKAALFYKDTAFVAMARHGFRFLKG
jgi:mannobiose 2-epimerase